MSKSGAFPGTFHQALRELASWFERQKRILPWRDEPTLYRVWISEIMLQQTQVVTVVPYFERFLNRFPSVEALAASSEDAVMHAWAGLGYYSRARNLHRAAKTIVSLGAFPRERAGWLEIPGVGDYTAGAILSIALDQPEAILDGNVERVLSRIWLVDRARGDAAYKQRLWKLSRAVVRGGDRLRLRPSVINQALMELGATLCSPRKPKCLLCPLAGVCRAHRTLLQEAYPPKKKPKVWIQLAEEVHCLLNDQGQMLLHQRGAGEWRAGLWDFSSAAPVSLGWAARDLEKVGQVERKLIVTRHKITRTAHVWRLKNKGLTAAESSEGARWVSVRNPEIAVGASLKKTVQSILETFPELF
jgi:A/G-specific adenine glycosylase